MTSFQFRTARPPDGADKSTVVFFLSRRTITVNPWEDVREDDQIWLDQIALPFEFKSLKKEWGCNGEWTYGDVSPYKGKITDLLSDPFVDGFCW